MIQRQRQRLMWMQFGTVAEGLRSLMPAIWLFVVTGNTRDDVAETLSSDIAKVFVLGVPDAESALNYAAKVPDSLLREALLTGTPAEVLEQTAQRRDHGARYA